MIKDSSDDFHHLDLVVDEEFECARCTLEELRQKDRAESFAGLRLLGYQEYYKMGFASYI
jgi:hypothetical protein